jgi:hypothetical protein
VPTKWHVIRNTGGGTSDCCSVYPHAAGARVADDRAIELQLLPRSNRFVQKNRNGARVYLAEQCPEHFSYSEVDYAALPLLGRTLSVTVDVSGVECGCNAAFYLVSMRQNDEAGLCDDDFYCDANKVCGVNCAELDLVEANKRAFHATAHTAFDGGGEGAGVGGHTHAWSAAEYGPGGSEIDTTQPFRVHSHFRAVDGELVGLDITLSQLTVPMAQGSAGGGTLRVSVASSSYLRRLSRALKAGMTPVASYWSAEDLRPTSPDASANASATTSPCNFLAQCRRKEG